MKKKNGIIYGSSSTGGSMPVIKRRSSAGKQHAGSRRKACIVVDAGHGGDDPGKIGIHGELEKDINLAIAKKVKARLEKENITVILTRETDESLDKGESGSKKVADMRNRCRLIDERSRYLP